MNIESVALLRWIPSHVLVQGEASVSSLLETALAETVRAQGVVPVGSMRVRKVQPSSYPQAVAGKPADDPGAELRLVEVDVASPTPPSLPRSE